MSPCGEEGVCGLFGLLNSYLELLKQLFTEGDFWLQPGPKRTKRRDY